MVTMWGLFPWGRDDGEPLVVDDPWDSDHPEWWPPPGGYLTAGEVRRRRKDDRE